MSKVLVRLRKFWGGWKEFLFLSKSYLRQIARRMKFIRLIKSKIGKLNRHNDWNSINYDQVPFNFLNWFNFLPSVMPRHFSSSKLLRCEQFNFVFFSFLWKTIFLNFVMENAHQLQFSAKKLRRRTSIKWKLTSIVCVIDLHWGFGKKVLGKVSQIN